jgi:hypothetical protein
MRLIFSILCLSFLMVRGVHAQATCSAEVSYKWKKGDSEESTIHWATIRLKGEEEKAVRAALIERVVREKKKASEACKDLHENMSGCLTAKLASSSGNIRGLDFAARRTVSDAITQDCKLQQGRCLEILSPDPTCEVAKAAETGEEEVKKDAKGKEKKK